MLLKKDEFDTKFLELNSYKLYIDETTKTTFNDVWRGLNKIVGPSLVCCIVPWGHTFVPHLLTEGFKLIGTKCKYGQKLDRSSGIPVSSTGVKIRSSSSQESEFFGDIDTYSMLIETLSKVSRYHKDPAISKNNSKKIYKAWFSNSLFNGYADEVLVAQYNELNVGFMSLKVADKTALVDLVVVDPRYQNLSIGALLLSHAKQHLEGLGVNYITVETEVENIGANRFYQKNGFLSEEFFLVLHKHVS